MQFSQLIVLVTASLAATALAAPSALEKRTCPRFSIPAAKTICEKFLGVGNGQARKCERLVEQIAAQSCSCLHSEILYSETADNVYCKSNSCVRLS